MILALYINSLMLQRKHRSGLQEKNKSAVENAFGHWKKHKSVFPEFKNAKQYVEGTQKNEASYIGSLSLGQYKAVLSQSLTFSQMSVRI